MAHRVRRFKVYWYAENKDKIDIFIIKPDIRIYVPRPPPGWIEWAEFSVDTPG